MHLTERGGGERCPIELREGFREAYPELRAHRGFDVRERHGRHVVLQARERREIRVRQKIGARRQELAELDEGGAEALEVLGEVVGAGGVALVRARELVAEDFLEA